MSIKRQPVQADEVHADEQVPGPGALLAQIQRESSPAAEIPDFDVPTLVNRIAHAIDTDGDDQSEDLRTFYERQDDSHREAIDLAFTYVCGWTLKTLIEQLDQGEQS